MKNLFLLCNAHLDPVWLWRWNEGAAEAISTFRVAAEFCEQYDGFVFNHNEAVLYEWILEYEPELFARIQKLVKEGKWKIMGGWYLQPDCNLPTGDCIIKQIEVGREFFEKHFGVTPTTAINFDPFGHSIGLVQILKKAGYDAYIVMRPGKLEHGDFIWRGLDGSEVIGHRCYEGYNTARGEAAKEIKEYCEKYKDNENGLLTWGIGNHGGGPSRIDLENIAELMKSSDVNIIHSDSEEYFKTLDKSKLPVRTASLHHIMVGCYSSMARIKQKNRICEGKISLCEKMLCASGVDYDKKALEEAWKSLLFCQFHDILPGSMIMDAETDSLARLGYVEDVADKLIARAFFNLCRGQKKANDGEIPIIVYNPHPYEIEDVFETEVQLADQNWNIDETTVITVLDENRNPLPSQNESEQSALHLDWRKKVSFKAKLKPMSINRFDCKLDVYKDYAQVRPHKDNGDVIEVTTDRMTVSVNKKTGLIDRYCVDGKELLKENSCKLEVFKDNEDPWGFVIDAYPEKIGEFILVSREKANQLNSYPEVDIDNVRIIENGDVRMKIQAVFAYMDSFAFVTYSLPKSGADIDVNIRVLSNNGNIMCKLSFDTTIENSEYWGQTMFGREQLIKEGNEVTYQKWSMLKSEEKSFAVINGEIYGGSCIDNKMYLSLYHTAVNAALTLDDRDLRRVDRYTPRIDMGERHFNIRLTSDISEIDLNAEAFNQKPYILSFFPSGSGEKKEFTATVDNRNILMTSMALKDGKIIVRMYNTKDIPQGVKFNIGTIAGEADFGKYEVKTFIVSDGEIKEGNIFGK